MVVGNVGYVHPEYDKYKDKVKVVNDVFNGTDSVTQYIKRFPQEADDTYEARVTSIALRNFVKRSAEAFVGMIFRKPINTTGYSYRVNKRFKTIDTKTSLNQFARNLATDLIVDGITYIMVENSPNGASEPYFVNIKRGDVVNWRKDEQNNFTMIVIKEVISEQDPEDEFQLTEIEQWRVLRDDGTVTIYRLNDDGDYYIYNILTTDLDYIPVVELELSKIPTLYDIAKLNIKHLNRTSAKDRYLDMSACPVPVIWGADIDDDDTPSTAKPALVIGVDEAFIFNGTKDECDFQWRELQGTSINELQKDLSVIEKDITSGVIRASQSDSQTIKTATQAYYESAEASNRVTVIANVVEYGLTVAVEMLIDYMNEPAAETGAILINKDYNALASDSGQVRLLWEMYLGGALSIDTLLSSLEQYEMISVGNPQDEVARIEADNFEPKPRVDSTSELYKNTDNTVVPKTD